MKLSVTLIQFTVLLAFHVVAVQHVPDINNIPIIFCENLSDDIVVIYNQHTNNLIVVEQGIEYTGRAACEAGILGTSIKSSYAISADITTDVALMLPTLFAQEASFGARLEIEKNDRSPGARQSSSSTVSLSCQCNTIADIEAQISQLEL